jgi:hypothetical protein
LAKSQRVKKTRKITHDVQNGVLPIHLSMQKENKRYSIRLFTGKGKKKQPKQTKD